jgi:hypothetical protein
MPTGPTCHSALPGEGSGGFAFGGRAPSYLCLTSGLGPRLKDHGHRDPIRSAMLEG